MYCCESFKETLKEGLFLKAEVQAETEWYMAEGPHLYYCPFCGAQIHGRRDTMDEAAAAEFGPE